MEPHPVIVPFDADNWSDNIPQVMHWTLKPNVMVLVSYYYTSLVILLLKFEK